MVPCKLDVQSQGDGRVLDVDGQGVGGGGLKNWTISMDVICVSSVGVIQNEFKMYFYIDVESYNRISINSVIKIFRTTAR